MTVSTKRDGIDERAARCPFPSNAYWKLVCRLCVKLKICHDLKYCISHSAYRGMHCALRPTVFVQQRPAQALQHRGEAGQRRRGRHRDPHRRAGGCHAQRKTIAQARTGECFTPFVFFTQACQSFHIHKPALSSPLKRKNFPTDPSD